MNLKTQDELKREVAQAALDDVRALPCGSWLGVGTGSTVNAFIDALATLNGHLGGAVSSSEASSARLRAIGLAVVDADAVREPLLLYVDGADEIDPHGCMIKGGGAALTREKIVADLSQRFLCIADASKRVAVLGRFPLPVEVIPMALPQVARRFEQAYGGQPRVREGVVTDNGQAILDVRGLSITDPVAFERDVNQWPGVVTVGVFARHRAQAALFAGVDGVERVLYPDSA